MTLAAGSDPRHSSLLQILPGPAATAGYNQSEMTPVPVDECSDVCSEGERGRRQRPGERMRAARRGSVAAGSDPDVVEAKLLVESSEGATHRVHIRPQ